MIILMIATFRSDGKSSRTAVFGLRRAWPDLEQHRSFERRFPCYSLSLVTESQRLMLVSAARWLTFASSAAIVLGIAPSQILLGLALLSLLLSREKLSLPPIKLPLALFLIGTLLAVALSGDPKAGFPQVKKIYVFTQLLVAYTLLRSTRMARWLVLTWACFGAASALLGVGQFILKLHQIQALH